MEIELLTTKKKLTKNILNQMYISSFEDMKKGNILGIILNSRKNHSKVILIERDNEYSLLPIYNWEKTETNRLYRKDGKWTRYKTFDSEKERRVV